MAAHAPGPNIHDAIEQATREAREVCEHQGDRSAACVVAWDTVEELQAEAAHQRQRQQHRQKGDIGVLDKYCAEHPDAPECRVYDL